MTTIEYFIKEEFKKQQNLKFFYGAGAVKEGGYYPLKKENSYYPHLKLSDTAINPKGWNNCKLHIGYIRFDEDALLCIAVGKENLNDKADKAKIFVYVMRNSITVVNGKNKVSGYGKSDFSGMIEIIVKDKILTVKNQEISVSIKTEEKDICGYLDLSCENGEFHFSYFDVLSDVPPFTAAQHNQKLCLWRKKQLDLKDKKIDKLEEYIKENPDCIHTQKCFINVPHRLVDKGETARIELIFPNTKNVAFCVTHNCMSLDSEPVSYKLDIKTRDEYTSKCEIDILFDKPGNTKLELWADGQKAVRNIAVYDKGYMALISWIGVNMPCIDEEIHRYDIAGDVIIPIPKLDDIKWDLKNLYNFTKNIHRYGDRGVCFICAKDLLPDSETTNIYELDLETQKRGFEQVIRICKILNMGMSELFGSYSIASDGIKILEELGVKGLTSLCVWQNWQDGTTKINHWGAANQPYYPSNDDFRRAGDKRNIMCFSMGNASDIRNRSIMTMESCPSLCVPGERYMENRVQHFQLQRFYDAFDGYISDTKNSDEMLIFTLSLEGFCKNSDWTCANENAMRYVRKKAAKEKIIFTSAADVSDYHIRKNLKMQKAYFYQPDYYYGYHNGELSGRTPDRIEADTPEFLAVIKRGNPIPEYYFDYTKKWNFLTFEDNKIRNEFGLINPDTFDTSSYTPLHKSFEDVTIESTLKDNKLIILIKSDREYSFLPTAVFDIPLESGFSFSCDDKSIKINKIYDTFTHNTHLFLVMQNVKKGYSEYCINLNGKNRKPICAEIINDKFGAMWFSNHAYIRCLDKDRGISVSFKAPDKAYIVRQDGKIIKSKNGMLNFSVNCDWYDEAPILYGFSYAELVRAVKNAKISDNGKSLCKRWSW